MVTSIKKADTVRYSNIISVMVESVAMTIPTPIDFVLKRRA